MLKIAVIGCPIGHSLSPKIHGAALESLGEKYAYEKIEVKPGELGGFLDYAKNNLDGFNLTMPHKVDIIPYLDEISEEAEMFSSVNTVKVKNGKFYGHNTDADGYVDALKNAGISHENKNILILGAGGVVRTLAKKLSVGDTKEIVILNRTEEKARKIADEVDKCRCAKLTYDVLAEACKTADVLINATPLGMDGCKGDFENTEFLENLKPDAFVSDLIYAPPKTTLLRSAERLGLRIMNGFDMLIFQAIRADEIYLERNLNIEKIYEDVIEKCNR